MRVLTRKEWDARAPKGAYASMPRNVRGVKVHYTGSPEDPAMLANHKRCVNRIKSIQNGHMDGNGWIDIGYSFVVCSHGDVFTGRGLGHLPAANGPGLNSGHYAVLGLVGNSGLTSPTAEMIAGIRDAIAFIRQVGHTGNEIKGHRDGYSTDCPGHALYELVKNGSFEPSTPVEEEEELKYLSLGFDQNLPLDLPAGEWTTAQFDVEFADPDGMHATGRFPSVLTGHAVYTAELGVTIQHLVPGVEGQVRFYEVDEDNKRGKTCAIAEWEGTNGKTFVHHTGVGTVGAGSKLRAEVIQFGDMPAQIVDCTMKVAYSS